MAGKTSTVQILTNDLRAVEVSWKYVGGSQRVVFCKVTILKPGKFMISKYLGSPLVTGPRALNTVGTTPDFFLHRYSISI